MAVQLSKSNNMEGRGEKKKSQGQNKLWAIPDSCPFDKK